MMLIKLIILVAISYCCCCCSLISCASGSNNESDAGSSISGNANSQSVSPLQIEMESLGKLLFIAPVDFARERLRLWETNEVGPLLNRFANLQDRFIASQTDSQLQGTHGQAQNPWANPRTQVLVRAMQEFANIGEEENKETIRRTCENKPTMKTLKRTRFFMRQKFPLLLKFTEENYARILEKCVDLLRSSFELFLSFIHDQQRIDGRHFGSIIHLSINKFKSFGPKGDVMMKQMRFAEAAARYVETFGGPETMRRIEGTNEFEFKYRFKTQAEIMMDSVCQGVREHLNKIFLDNLNVLLQIEPSQLESLNNLQEFKDWMSVAIFCQYWPHKINPEMVYNAHVSSHLDLDDLKHVRSLSDVLFSPLAQRISDPDAIETGLKLLRDKFAVEAARRNHMFRLNIRELNFLLEIKNGISEAKYSIQQIEAFIRYYELNDAHNIVFYINSLINEQTGDNLAEMETILRAGIQEMAYYPRIHADLRDLRRFLPDSGEMIPELTTSDLLTSLSEYFLYNFQNFQQISDARDHQSRKGLVIRWFEQFMNDNCERYKNSFNGLLAIYNKLRPERTIRRFDDELRLALFNVILCSDMDNNIRNQLDALTRLISRRVDGGGPSDRIN